MLGRTVSLACPAGCPRRRALEPRPAASEAPGHSGAKRAAEDLDDSGRTHRFVGPPQILHRSSH